jgi:two-component system cell cycle sensor histidine kinase/response regulator CckA
MAEELSADPGLTGTLKEIGVAADRAESLADDLLAFGRRALAEPRPVDLGDLIRGISDLLSVAAGGGVRIDFRLPQTGGAAVLADPGQLEQVLLNLVLNARDAMPDGGTLTIAARAVERCIEVTVADTGIGMSPQLTGQIFEPFFTTKPGTGTGLGLSAVSSIVTEAGGSIEVDSGEGRGTAFRIYLPALPA